MSKKLIIVSIILGVILTFGSFILTGLLGVGDLNTTNGENSIPVGVPFDFMIDDCSETDPDEIGRRCPDVFNTLPFVLDLIIWSVILLIMILAIKRLRSRNG